MHLNAILYLVLASFFALKSLGQNATEIRNEDPSASMEDDSNNTLISTSLTAAPVDDSETNNATSNDDSSSTNETFTTFTELITEEDDSKNISTSPETFVSPDVASDDDTDSENTDSDIVITLSTEADRPCNNNPCRNGGTCEVNEEGIGYTCICPTSHVGTRCQIEDFCIVDEGGALCGNGVCVYSEDMTSRYCKCFSGTHWDFENQICREAEPPCFPNPCQNGGSCLEAEFRSAGIHACTCLDGFLGISCEFEDICGRDPGTGELCGNGTCVGDASARRKYCECQKGFYLNHDTNTCQAANPPCEPNPCNGHDCEPQPDGGYNCTCNTSLFGVNCEIVDNCSEGGGNMKCENGLCMHASGETSWQCHCLAGFVKDEISGKCVEEKKPCVPNPCANEGFCTPISETKYECSCVDGFTGPQCRVRDRCALDGGSVFCGTAACATDFSRNTIYCDCGEGLYFDYANRICRTLDMCKLMTCEEHEECVNSTCVCAEGFKRNADTNKCAPDYCSVKGCPYKNMECEENTDYPGSHSCYCPEGEAFDGSKCTASSCLFPSTNQCEQVCEQNDGGYSCECFANYGLKADNKSCELLEDAKCLNTTCDTGVCSSENDTVICACSPGYTEVGSKCVDLCTAGRLPKGLCPQDACETDEQKGFKCKCSGKYKYAKDGVTCAVRNLCLPGESGFLSCEQKRASCEESWESAEGYFCRCEPGFEEHDGVCERICDIDDYQQKCFRLGATCALDEDYNFLCKCPPAFTVDEYGICNQLAPLSFVVTLPLDARIYGLEKQNPRARMMVESTVDYDLVEADITKTMRQLFGGFLVTNILSCKRIGDFELCKVEVQLSYLSEEDSFKRLLRTSSCFYNDSISKEACLIPPSLALKKDRILTHVFFKLLDPCDDDVKQGICDPDTICESYQDGFSCSCKPGFRERKRDFPIKDDVRIFTEHCVDIDECMETPRPCSQVCTNTLGSYRCSCLPGYRESNQSASGCVELCDPSPCLHGKCEPSTLHEFECRCEPGYAGAFCNYEDKNYKGARVNTIIVGVVLGGILLVTVILFATSISRLKRKKFSDDPTRVLYNTEMLERRPVRLNAANPAFERD